MNDEEQPPEWIDISPDYACAYAWDEEGVCAGFVDYWPDIPELADLEEKLIAWAETYDRMMSGIHKVIEVFDMNDIEGYYKRGEALATELARLLNPKRVPVSFCGKLIEIDTAEPNLNDFDKK